MLRIRLIKPYTALRAVLCVGLARSSEASPRSVPTKTSFCIPVRGILHIT